MSRLPQRKTDEPRPFPLRFVIAALLVIAVVTVVAVALINASRQSAVVSYATPTTNEGQLFATALMQMGTAKAQGMPDNPLVLTAKALGTSTPNP